ncbi:histidine kinase [Sphingobacteriaceae bacterium]|nr:histidine kinase [Sphingobacteriaceae bacterium]
MKENYSLILVDDDPDDHFFFQQALKKINAKCELTSVYSGIELLNLLLKKEDYSANLLPSPDLIILDLNMPSFTGFDTLERMKSNSLLSDIPVFVMSTSDNPKDSRKAIDMGALGYYGKPGTAGKLPQIIAEILISI